MTFFVRAIANELRSLANNLENQATTNDYVQFRLDRLMDDLAQRTADMNVDIEPAGLVLKKLPTNFKFCQRQKKGSLDVRHTIYPPL